MASTPENTTSFSRLPGYSSGVLYNVEVQKKKTSDLGERLILTRDQGEMIIVKGSVFFKEGHSVTGAKIEVEQVNSDGSTKKLGSTTQPCQRRIHLPSANGRAN